VDYCLPTSLKHPCSICKFKKTIKICLQSRIFDTVWHVDNHYLFSKIYNVIYQLLCSATCWPSLFECVSVCLSTYKFIVGSQLWWAFFCFSGSPSSCYFIFYICSINLYCTLANKYDDDDDESNKLAGMAVSEKNYPYFGLGNLATLAREPVL